MLLDNQQIRKLYDRIARFYDAALFGYRLAGLDRFRRAMADGLNLDRGDLVVDLGCGTGGNLPYLQAHVGASGRIVGVDLSEQMLSRAQGLARRNGWTNVALVRADMAEFQLPPRTKGVCAAFALEMLPDYDSLVARLADELPSGGRLSVLGLKYPERWPRWLTRVAIFLNRPFGLNPDYADQRPYRSVERHFDVHDYREWLGGAVYLCVGRKSPAKGAAT